MSALIDTAQIAQLLGVSREYVTDKLTKRTDFPRPKVNVSQRLRKWSEAEVRQWAAGPQKRAA
jgi:predicted DNA-binding transcriptional regulator AlpA